MVEETFDPYHRWLGIPPSEQPANHYRLLGLTLFESNQEVIDSAAMRQIAHIRSQALGPNRGRIHSLLNELAEARVTLLNPQSKSKYDQDLRESSERDPATPQDQTPEPTGHGIPNASQQAKSASIAASPPPPACPTCGTRLIISEQSTGKKVRCTNCGTVLQVSSDGLSCTESPLFDASTPRTSARKTDDLSSSRLPSFSQGGGGTVRVATATEASLNRANLSQQKSAGSRARRSAILGVLLLAVGVASIWLWNAPKKQSPGNSGNHLAVQSAESQDAGKVPEDSVQSKPAPQPVVAPFDAAKAKAYQQEWADYLKRPQQARNSIGMGFVLIPPGNFTMGCNVFDEEERPTHSVSLTQTIEFGQHEVTQKQFAEVVGHNPSVFKSSDKPVDSVSWDDAVTFCKLLSDRPAEKAAGYQYRLPTESEWEYACRAGAETDYWFGNETDKLKTVAFYSENSEKQTHPVKTREANPWGLYDMYGNVSEWCQDFHAEYSEQNQTNPTGPSSGNEKVDVRVLVPPFSNSTRTANSTGATRTGLIVVPVNAFKTEIGVIRSADHAPDTMGIRHAGKYGWIDVNGKRIVSCAAGHAQCKACKAKPDHLGYDITSMCEPGETLKVDHRHRQISPSLGIRIRFHLSGHVHRGGGFNTEAIGCRSATRGTSAAIRKSNSLGFRVVRVSQKQPAGE